MLCGRLQSQISNFSYMNTASDFSHSKNFFNFLKLSEHFTPACVVVYMGRKKFFQKLKLNIIDREKNLKPFDKIPVVKIFKIIYHTTVTIFFWLTEITRFSLYLLDASSNRHHFLKQNFSLALFKSCYIVTQQNMSEARFSLHACFCCLCNGFFVLQFFLRRVVNVL